MQCFTGIMTNNVLGFNCTEEEDFILVGTLVRRSEDSIVGSEQKGSVFYENIWEYFKEENPAKTLDSPLNSIITRLNLIIN